MRLRDALNGIAHSGSPVSQERRTEEIQGWLLGFDRATRSAYNRAVKKSDFHYELPPELIAHHVNAIQAIVRENDRIDALGVSAQLSKKLRGVADEYLTHVNRDRPEHLEAILAPSIIPAD